MNERLGTNKGYCQAKSPEEFKTKLNSHLTMPSIDRSPYWKRHEKLFDFSVDDGRLIIGSQLWICSFLFKQLQSSLQSHDDGIYKARQNWRGGTMQMWHIVSKNAITSLTASVMSPMLVAFRVLKFSVKIYAIHKIEPIMSWKLYLSWVSRMFSRLLFNGAYIN